VDIVLDNTKVEFKSFEEERWAITRGLQRKPGEPWLERNEQYLDILPTFNGKNFLEVISEKVRGGGKTRFLDIGGGAALADLEVRSIHASDKLDIEVIGHEDDTKLYLSDVPRRITRGPTEQDLKDNQIGFNFIDFTKLSEKDVELLGRFDVIVAVYSITWMKHTKYELLQQVENLLKPSGVAFIGPLQIVKLINESSWEQESAFSYLNRKYGSKININNGGVAFQKLQNKTQLPNIFQSLGVDATVEQVKLLTQPTQES